MLDLLIHLFDSIANFFTYIQVFLSDTYDSVVNFFNYIKDVWDYGLYEYIKQLIEYILKKLSLLTLEFLGFIISLAMDILTSFIDAIGYKSFLSSTYAGLSSDVIGFLGVLKVPQAINIGLAAYAYRFVVKLIPGL